MLSESEIWTALLSEQCWCGRTKLSGRSFCSVCYRRLFPMQQKRLYLGKGAGYEEAYEVALVYLAGLFDPPGGAHAA